MTAMLSSIFQSVFRLGVFAALAAGLLSFTYWLTKEDIARQQALTKLEAIAQVLPQDYYDNALLESAILVSDTALLGPHPPYQVMLATRNGAPKAMVLEASTNQGYNGRIDVLIGVTTQGEILGVRVTRHQETPGLGDPIESRKSQWIRQFDGTSLQNPQSNAWDVKKHGGDFDQLTGATITPRAVVVAVYRALQALRENQASWIQRVEAENGP